MKIEIDIEELKILLISTYKLNALENCGVGNWEFYDEAMDEFLNEYGSFESMAEQEISNYILKDKKK